MVSAEMPSTSDEIRWVEQGRLHTRYDNVAISTNAFTVTFSANPDGGAHAASLAPNLRVGQTIMVQGLTSAGVHTGPVQKGVVTVAGAACCR